MLSHRTVGLAGLSAFAVLLPPPQARAQVQWTERQLVVTPSPRQRHAIAHHAGTDRVVMFGGIGRATSVRFGDTWEWDGARWQEARVPGPATRWAHRMVYDASRDRVVLFGGQSSSHFGDTWEWDGRAWTRVATTGPAPRVGHAMAYDAHRARVVLFGGRFGPSTLMNDVWEWDGATWTDVSPAAPPTPRQDHAMAYHAGTRRVVAYGGWAANGVRLADTWEWNGSQWTLRMQSSPPGPRANYAMAPGPARDRVVLFANGDTWEWDGQGWIERMPATSPPSRRSHAMTYDARRESIVLFGGDVGTRFVGADTWVYSPEFRAAYEPFGVGCAGTAGTPVLAAAPGQRPWVGEPFTVELTQLPPGQPAALSFGSSATTWSGLTLPSLLSALGLPACFLLASAEIVVPLGVQNGAASHTVQLCNCPSLLGGGYFNQGFVLDPTGLSLSNGARAVIGGK